MLRNALIVATALAALASSSACNRAKKSEPTENAAPSSSIISIAIGMAFCDDPAFCQKECDGGNADSCRRLGVTYELGKAGQTRDETKAAALYEKACAMQNAMACMSAGHLYEFGRGVAKDETRAAALYKSSCEKKYPAGCYNFAILAEEGRGVGKDELLAASYYDQACAAGARAACAKATELRDRAIKAPLVLDGGDVDGAR